jgi:diguanylate cyclase (GGDEF)-like protein/PAS domain S-box-containing protein
MRPSIRPRLSFKPFAARGRKTIAAILVTFALFTAVSVTLSISATKRSQHRAAIVEVAARQRTLAERYVEEVLLARAGAQADPTYTAGLLVRSATALLDGGKAPPVNGDDDETMLPAASGAIVRAQLRQERRLVADLTATGSALLDGRSIAAIRMTAHEHLRVTDPIQRLRVLAGLTSNVSLNAARTIATGTDRNITYLITLQVALGLGGLIASLLLAWALIAATRRQTAHFRSLVSSSTDSVLVFGDGGCRYVSESVKTMVGGSDPDLLGGGFERFVHPDDRVLVNAASEHAEAHQLLFRMLDRFGEWRHLEAHVTDLRGDRRVRGVVLNARDVTERVQLEEELTRQAFHDGLTGLANRALFRDRLDQALVRSERSHELLAVLIVDLDGFKQVNDTLGHDAGDQLLQQVSRRFGEATRPSDTVARLGGDEVALLLEGANELRAVAVANRLLECLAEPVTIADRELVVLASIGVVVHNGGPGKSEEIVRHADVAMYAAKEVGRGRYELFHHDMARELGELLGFEHELRLGLTRGEFSVHYQQLVDLESRAIVGVEALMRWTSPTRGAVAPDEFIPVAEATGLIGPLGQFVLREACRQTAQWWRDGVLPEGFSTWVNLSGKQLSAGGVSELVQTALKTAGLPPRLLGLEVTETAIVVDGVAGDRARAELQELHSMGVRIAIDDFGTGFSSLGHLRRFPVDVLKVDRSFVQGVEHDAKDAAITANLASLAHALGLVAIAEGVESDGQMESVRELGCDLAQGFLFAQPMPGEEVSRMLAERARSADPPVRRALSA